MTLSPRCRRGGAGPADGPPAAADPGGAGFVRSRRRRVRADAQGARPWAWPTSASLGLWDIARPHLEALVAGTGESSSMAQLDGSDIVYVARVVGAEAHRPAGRDRHPVPGGADLAGQGAAGRAARPTSWPRALAEPSRAGLPPYIGRTPEQLADELTEVRARGWALADEELAPGVRSVAVPVRDGAGAGPGGHERHRARRGDLDRAAAAASTCPTCCAPPATSAPSGRCGSHARTSRSPDGRMAALSPHDTAACPTDALEFGPSGARRVPRRDDAASSRPRCRGPRRACEAWGAPGSFVSARRRPSWRRSRPRPPAAPTAARRRPSRGAPAPPDVVLARGDLEHEFVVHLQQHPRAQPLGRDRRGRR